MRPHSHWSSLADMFCDLIRKQDYMDLSEAAALYRVTPETMRAWARQGLFGACYANGEWWLEREQLQHALRQTPRAPLNSTN